MIEIIQGTPGSGKSAVALVMGIEHLACGGALAANFELVPDWSWKLAGMNWFVRLGLKDRLKRAEELRRRCFRIGTAETIFQLSERLKDCGLSGKAATAREGKGLLILDEAQLIFNTRDFSKNKPWIEFFTQHRKLGWNVLLIAHHIQMVDKQIRPLVEIETRFRNLKNIRIPLLPIPLSPVNAFFAVRFYAGHGPGAGMVHNRGLYFLDLRLARLYDTLRVFAFDDLEQEVSLQGVPAEEAAALHVKDSPDFFLGQRFGQWLHRGKPSAKQETVKPARRPGPDRRRPGQVCCHYGDDVPSPLLLPAPARD